MSDSLPTLWHIEISHYSEKARWAFAYKGVKHRRRAPLPGSHMAFAVFLTRGARKTFPILQLEGRTIGDSTEIVEALERRYPDPPLYPADPAQRRQALELEEFFDEELGPHIRQLAFHEMQNDPDRLADVARRAAPPALARFGGMAAVYARTFSRLRWKAEDVERAELARQKVIAALDRVEAELDGGDYLVGDTFTVADLTAASLLYPLVLPPQGPTGEEALSKGLRSFREPLEGRRGFLWVQEMFARHRKPAGAGAYA